MADLDFKMVLDLVDKASPKLKESGSNFKKFGNLLKVVAASAAVAGFGVMIKSQIDAADELAKLSQKIGVTVEDLSTMRHAAELSGVDILRFSDGIKDLSRKLLDLENPTARSTILFRELGIEVKDTEGKVKSSFDVFLAIADAFQGMEDGGIKTAAAMELLGESGLQMIPLLNAGSEGIRAMQKEAENLGLQISTKTAKQAEQFNDSMTRMSANMTGAATAGTAELLPTLNAITDALVASQNAGGGFAVFFEGLNEIFKVLALTVGGFTTTLTILGKTIGAVAAAIGLAASGDFKAARQVFSDLKVDIDKTTQGFVDFQDALYNPAVIENNKQLRESAKNLKDLAAALAGTGKKADEFIAALRKESELLGLSAGDQKRYEVNTIAATLANDDQKKSFIKSTEALIKKIEAHERMLELQEIQNEEFEKELELRDAEVQSYEDSIKSARESVEQMEFENTLLKLNNEDRQVAIKLRALEAAGIKEGSVAYDEFAERIKAAVHTSVEANKEGAQTVGEFWAEAARSMEGVMSTFFFDIMQGNVTDLGDSFKRMIDRMVADFIASQLLTSAFGAGFGASFGGFRAAGGPVSAGVPYIVGEQRAEVFVPNQNGTILPSTSGMGGTQNINMTIHATDAKSFKQLAASEPRFFADLVNKANRAYNKR